MSTLTVLGIRAISDVIPNFFEMQLESSSGLGTKSPGCPKCNPKGFTDITYSLPLSATP